MSGLLDHAIKGDGDRPMGYVYSAEVCEADVTGDQVKLTSVLLVGCNTGRLTPERIAAAYRQRVDRPIQHARIRLYGQL